MGNFVMPAAGPRAAEGVARSGTTAERAAMEKRLRQSGMAVQTGPIAARPLFY